MSRLFSFALIVVTTVFGYALYTQQDVGYIKFGLGSLSIETSLLVFGALIIASLFVVLMLLRVLERFNKGVSVLSSLFRLRFTEKSRHALSNSLIDIAEGHYEKAEKRLLKAIKNNNDPFPLYLTAASAAHEQNADEQRDEYLQLALDTNWQGKPKADIAMGLVKAEFYLKHDQPEQAINTLTSLENDSPKHGRVLALLSEAYRRLSRWSQLRELMSKLYKNKTLPDEQIRALELETWYGLIKDNATPDNAALLFVLWDEMPAHVKTSDELFEFYVCTLKNIKQDDIAAKLLLENLKHEWRDALIILYADLDAPADNTQMETIEGWLEQHPDNAHLLLLLGKMCTKLGLWGKARSYLEASLSIKPAPQTCLRLATLLEEHLGEPESAQNYYRKGLHLLVDNTVPTIVSEETQKENQPRLKIVTPK